MYNGNIRSVLHGQTRPEDIGQSQGQQMMDIAWKRYSYDQLNRITGSVVDETSGSNLSLSGGVANWGVVDHANHYGTGHTYDANGNILSLTRSYQGVMIDDLNYYYANQAAVAQTGSMSWGLNSYFTNNQLLYVEDNAAASGTKGDLLTQAVGNYEYEEDGALLKDASEEIDEIIWTASGKLKEVKRITSSSKPDLEYRYDAWDNRMLKIVKPSTGTNHHYTQYVRDMNGNVMAVYEYTVNSSLTPPYTLGGMPAVYLKEQMLYGAQRLGVIKRDLMVSGPIQIVDDGLTALGLGDPLTTDYMIRAYWQHLESENDGAYKEFGSSAPEIIDHVVLSTQLQTLAKEANRSGLYITSVASVQLIPMMQRYERIRGRRHYELSNFRGDVRQVVTDIRIAIDETGDSKAEYYEADVIQVEDAYPFGWSIEDRSFAHNEAYRFSFSGMEKDENTCNGGYDFGARIFSTVLGRWWSADPKESKYPMYSPYHGMANNPIITIDPDGEENVVVVGNQSRLTEKGKKQKPISDLIAYPQGCKRHFLEEGLNQAIRMKNKRTANGEATTMVVYKGSYTSKELKYYEEKAKKNGINFIVKNSANEIERYLESSGYVDGKKSTRKNDLITDFAYVGHASPEKLLLGEYHKKGDDLGPYSFKYGSFHRDVEIDLNGCGTAATKEVNAKGKIVEVKPLVYNRLKNVIAKKISGWQTPVYWKLGPKGEVGAHKGYFMYTRPHLREKLKGKIPRLKGKITEEGGSYNGKPSGSWNKNRKVNGKDLK